MDGTLIEAWASQKSFQPRDGGDGDGANFHGQQRRNDTHESHTAPDAGLYRKSSAGSITFLSTSMRQRQAGLKIVF